MRLRILLWIAVAVGLTDFAAYSITSYKYDGAVPTTPVFIAIPDHGPYLLDNHGVLRKSIVTLTRSFDGRAKVG